MTNMLFATPAYRTCAAAGRRGATHPVRFRLEPGLKDVRPALKRGRAEVPLPLAGRLRDSFSKSHGGRRSRPRPGRARPRRPPARPGFRPI